MTADAPPQTRHVALTGWRERAAEPCPHRGRSPLGEMPDGQLYECALPLSGGYCTTGSLVRAVKACGWCQARPETAAKLVPLVAVPERAAAAPAPPAGVPGRVALDCVFRGEPDGETIGTSKCGANGRRVAVYPCEAHGSCTVEHTACPDHQWCRTCRDRRAARPEVRVLVEFPHGLGDVCQYGVVLQHLRRQRPEWAVDARVLPGRGDCLRGLARRVFESGDGAPPERADYDRVLHVGFPPAPAAEPATKTARCLREMGLTPDPTLFRYHCEVSDTDRAAAADYLRSLGPAVVAHHKGHTAKSAKDLADADLVPLADKCRRRGVRLVVLDFDGETGRPLVGHPAVSPLGDPAFRTAGRIAALKGRAVAWVGIDSGPGHVGGAVDTLGFVCWHGMDPRRFYDPYQPHVTHLVPRHLAGLGDGYREQVYFDLATELPRHIFGETDGK